MTDAFFNSIALPARSLESRHGGRMRTVMSCALVMLALSFPVNVRGDDADEPSPPPEECSYKVAGALECTPSARDPNGYALMATEKVEVGSSVLIQGRVYALGNGLASGEFAVTIGTKSHVDGSVIAPSTRIGAGAQVRDLQTNLADVVGGDVARQPYIAPAQSPVIRPDSPGFDPVHVRGEFRLEPGRYAAVEVAPGATLLLVGGEYAVTRFRIGLAARVLVLAATRLTATESIEIGDKAQVGPHPASGHSLNLTMISGAPLHPSIPAIAIGRNAEVISILYAASGNATIGTSKINGSVTARNISAESGAAISTQPSLAVVDSCSYRACYVDPLNNYVCKKVTVKIDDGDPCTIDSCGLFGVAHAPVPSGSSCTLKVDSCATVAGTCSALGSCKPIIPLTLGAVSWTKPLPKKDLAIAAGQKYILAGGNSTIAFYDRNGAVVVPPTPSWNLFAPIFDPAQLSINTKEGFTSSDALTCSSASALGGIPPFPARGSSIKCAQCPSWDYCRLQNSCINDAYEMRVAHDCRHDRYVVQVHLRNQIWNWVPGYEDNNPCSGHGHTSDPAKNALVRRHVAFAVSKSGEPTDGFRYYWLPHNYYDQPALAISGAYLVSTHINEYPDLDMPYVTLNPWEGLVSGSVAEGAISGWTYKAGDLGLPLSGDMGMRPLVQHGIAEASDGKPEPDAAFVLQLASFQKSFTVRGFWPQPGNSIGKPLAGSGIATGDQTIPYIHSAVLQNSYVYFVSDDGKGTILLGRAAMWTKHGLNNEPILEFGKVEFAQPLSAGPVSTEKYNYPSLEVTYDGNAFVTFHSLSTGLFTAISVKIAVFDKSLNLVSLKEVVTGDTLASFGGVFKPDYITSSVDPLYPWQVWFTAVSSPGGTQQFSIGAVQP